MGKTYRTSQLAQEVNSPPAPIRRRDLPDRFPARRAGTGQRYCTDKDMMLFLEQSPQDRIVSMRALCPAAS